MLGNNDHGQCCLKCEHIKQGRTFDKPTPVASIFTVEPAGELLMHCLSCDIITSFAVLALVSGLLTRFAYGAL